MARNLFWVRRQWFEDARARVLPVAVVGVVRWDFGPGGADPFLLDEVEGGFGGVFGAGFVGDSDAVVDDGLELVEADGPGVVEGFLAAALGVHVLSASDGGFEVVVEPAGFAMDDDVSRAFDGVGGDGDAACHGFDEDDAEGVGEAWENEDVGFGEMCGEVVAVF